MVSEFCGELNAFGLTQHINKTTHMLGHILDHILSYGLSADNAKIEDAAFCDDKPCCIFDITLSNPLQSARTPFCYSYI